MGCLGLRSQSQFPLFSPSFFLSSADICSQKKEWDLFQGSSNEKGAWLLLSFRGNTAFVALFGTQWTCWMLGGLFGFHFGPYEVPFLLLASFHFLGPFGQVSLRRKQSHCFGSETVLLRSSTSIFSWVFLSGVICQFWNSAAVSSVGISSHKPLYCIPSFLPDVARTPQSRKAL